MVAFRLLSVALAAAATTVLVASCSDNDGGRDDQPDACTPSGPPTLSADGYYADHGARPGCCPPVTEIYCSEHGVVPKDFPGAAQCPGTSVCGFFATDPYDYYGCGGCDMV